MICSSDEEDMYDAEISEFLRFKMKKKPSHITLRLNYFNLLGDREFHERFRLTKASAYCVLNLIAPHIKRPTK